MMTTRKVDRWWSPLKKTRTMTTRNTSLLVWSGKIALEKNTCHFEMVYSLFVCTDGGKGYAYGLYILRSDKRREEGRKRKNLLVVDSR